MRQRRQIIIDGNLGKGEEMIVNLWPGIIAVLTALGLLIGCAANPYTFTGAAVGGGLGALTGAAIDNRNPWRGGALGGVIGGVLGGVTGEALRQRRATQPPLQGYYYQTAPPGYGTSPTPDYSDHAPAPVGPPAPGSGYGYGSSPPAYSRQNQAPQIYGSRTPTTYAPYYY
jgi:hypothetical protein